MSYDVSVLSGYQYKEGIKISMKTAILMVVVAFMIAVCGCMMITYTVAENYANSTTYLESRISAYQTQVEDLETRLSTTSAQYESQIESLNAEIATLESIANQSASEMYALSEKYYYVLRDAPEGEGVDMALIAYMDEKAKEKNVSAHLAWGMIEHESGYIATAQNPTSTARGLGQFLRSTARTFYEQDRFLGHGEGTYTHDMIDNPYLAVDLITEYLQYLYENYGDTKTMLRYYSGSNNDNYYYEVQSYMQSVGTDITVATYY